MNKKIIYKSKKINLLSDHIGKLIGEMRKFTSLSVRLVAKSFTNQ